MNFIDILSGDAEAHASSLNLEEACRALLTVLNRFGETATVADNQVPPEAVGVFLVQVSAYAIRVAGLIGTKFNGDPGEVDDLADLMYMRANWILTPVKERHHVKALHPDAYARMWPLGEPI